MTQERARIIYTDKLAAYFDGIELTFGSDTEHRLGNPFDIENNTNLIERFHSTLKSRTEIMRGMQNPTTADLIKNGWLIYYNFFRPHEALRDLPPKGLDKTSFKYPFTVFTIVYAWFIIGGKEEIIGGKCNASREDYDKNYYNKNHHNTNSKRSTPT